MKYILPFLLLLPLCASSQDTINRIFTGVATFANMDTVSGGKFQGTVYVNDLSGVYRANQILVGDRLYLATGATYTVDSVWAATTIQATVRFVQNSSLSARPSGSGLLTRPTTNYGLPMIAADNANGISTQLQALLLSSLTFKVDSLMRDSLSDLRDVVASLVKNNSFLVYDSLAGHWKDSTVAFGLSSAGTGASGRVAYFTSSDSIGGDSALYWNAANDRLGIGTANPSHKLEIKGSLTANLRLNNTSTGTGNLLLAHNDTTIWSFGSSAANNNFRLYNNIDSVTAFLITEDNSNVGIGTTSPTYKLDVNGKGRFQDTILIGTKRVLTTDDIGASKSLIDTLPNGSVTIDANSNTFRLDSMANFTAMVSTTAGITRGRTNTTTFLSNPRNNINNGFFMNPSIGSYLHFTDTTTYGTVYAYSDRAVMLAANSTFLSSLIEAEDSGIRMVSYKSSGSPGSQIQLTNDTLSISADTAVLINNVKMPTAAAPSDGSRYVATWVNGQPSFQQRVSSTTLTSGAVTVVVSLFGSGTPTISNLSAGLYKVTIPSGVDIRGLVVTANNTVLSGSNEFTLIVDNVANSSDQWYNVQLYDVSTSGFVDQHGTSTNHTQSISSNATTLVFPGMNLFGSTGFRIIMR
jgi:hypothetical protein